MTIPGTRKEVKCGACGHVGIIVGKWASECEKCGESVDPETGEAFGVKVSEVGGLD